MRVELALIECKIALSYCVSRKSMLKRDWEVSISFLNLYSKESNLQKKIWLIYFPYCSQFCIGRVFKALLNSPFQLFASSNFPLTYIIPKRKGQGHQRAQVLNPATLQSKRRLHRTWQQRVFGHCEKISKLVLYFQRLKFFPPIMRFFSV